MADKFENIEDGLNLKPLSSDPSNPKSGDLHISDGTARAIGLWAYLSAAWRKFSTIDGTETLTNKTIDSDSNTITNIVNADIKAAAAIDAEKIHDGSITNTEFGYLNGVTSGIQAQIDAKTSNPMTTSGDVIYGGVSGVPTRLPKGTDGELLTLVAGIPSWEAAPAGGALTVQTKTTTYTVLVTDDVILASTSGGVWTLSLYTPVGNSGKSVKVKKTTADFTVLTVDTAAGSIAENGTTVATTTLNTKDEEVEFVSDDISWHVLNRKTNTQSTAYTPTGTWISNATYTAFWRRFADCIFVEANIAVTGNPTAASLRFIIPSGLTIDTAKLSSMAGTESILGLCYVQDSGAQKYPPGKLEYFNTTTLALFYNTAATAEAAITNLAPTTFANGDNIKAVSFAIPIVGWKA
jgi:hypothetical protein